MAQVDRGAGRAEVVDQAGKLQAVSRVARKPLRKQQEGVSNLNDAAGAIVGPPSDPAHTSARPIPSKD